MLQEHLERYGMKCCPIDNSLKIIGKKFTLHIIRNMILLKQNKFNEFLKSIEGMSTKTLSIRLEEMENNGLISRIVVSERPIQVRYYLTEKSKELEPILKLLAEFSMKHTPKTIFEDGKSRDFEDVFGNKRKLSSVYDY